MMRRYILFLGGVLLSSPMVLGRQHSNGAVDALNGFESEDPSDDDLRPESRETQQDRNLQFDREAPEDRIPGRFEDGSREGQSDHEAMAPMDYQELERRLMRERQQERREEQRGGPSEEPRVPHHRFHVGHRQKVSRHKHQEPIDGIPPVSDHRGMRGEDGRFATNDEELERTAPTDEDFEFRQEPAATGSLERTSEEEEKEAEEKPPPESANRGPHYQGYEKYEGLGIYKFHAEGANDFDEANEMCTLEGGHLAIANSKDEADVFVVLWMRHGPKEDYDAYVGIHNRNPENAFKTILGDTLASTGYLAWRAGEPDNKNGVEHCVSFYRYGGYRDIPCSGLRPFICELRWSNEN